MRTLFHSCPSWIQWSSVVGSSFGRGMLVAPYLCYSLFGSCSLLVAISFRLSGLFRVYLMCISSSVVLVPAIADWMVVMPGLVLSVLLSVALVVLLSS